MNPATSNRFSFVIPLLIALMGGCGAEPDHKPGSPLPCAGVALPELDFTTSAGLYVTPSTYALPWDGSSRTVEMHIWYPTAVTSGEGARYLDAFPDDQSLIDAPYDPPDDTCLHPLVVWSHGSQAWAGNASSVLRQFINAGWVAAGPDHTGNTLTDNLDPRPPIFDLVRTADVTHTIDFIEALPESHLLFGRVDTSRVLVMGHSYGGQTSWLMSGPTFSAEGIQESCDKSDIGCSVEESAAYGAPVVDDRVVATVPLAGSAGSNLVAQDGWSTRRTPVFYMTGSADNDGSGAYESAGGTEISWLEIEGGCHETFTDTALPCEGVTKEEGLEITAAYATAYGTATVLGSTDPEVESVLDGTSRISQLVTLQSR